MKRPRPRSWSGMRITETIRKREHFDSLKVADIFMGGGTTIVEGSRLGMQMYGTDLNPVAWFVVKAAMAQASEEEVEALLADVEERSQATNHAFLRMRLPTWT